MAALDTRVIEGSTSTVRQTGTGEPPRLGALKPGGARARGGQDEPPLPARHGLEVLCPVLVEVLNADHESRGRLVLDQDRPSGAELADGALNGHLIETA